MRIRDWSSDVCSSDLVQDIRNEGLSGGKPAVLLRIDRQPGANIIETVDRIKQLLPQLTASIPVAIAVHHALDARKRCVSGKSVSVRVDLGGRGIINTKTREHQYNNNIQKER